MTKAAAKQEIPDVLVSRNPTRESITASLHSVLIQVSEISVSNKRQKPEQYA